MGPRPHLRSCRLSYDPLIPSPEPREPFLTAFAFGIEPLGIPFVNVLKTVAIPLGAGIGRTGTAAFQGARIVFLA